MSSLPGGVESIIAGSSPVGNVVGNPVADDPQHLDIRQVALNTCLKELLGQDGRRKRNQSGDDMALEAALVEVGEADALFIEGLRNMSYYSQSEISFKLFSEAEEKGCNHPVLYYFLGEYFRSGKVGTARDIAKAVHYYDMAIKGGCTWSYEGVSYIHELGVDGYPDRHIYLLDLEQTGIVDSSVYVRIAHCYSYGSMIYHQPLLAVMYLQRAMELGRPEALTLMRSELENSGRETEKFSDMMSWFLLQEDHILMKNNSVVENTIGWILSEKKDYRPKGQILSKFKNKGEIAIYYSDILIQRGLSSGYSYKAKVYREGLGGVERDGAKAVSIWEEAHNAGLADFDIYCRGLQRAYLEGHGVPADGSKVFMYGNKLLKLKLDRHQLQETVGVMANVYRRGVPPMSQDGTMVLDHYTRALRLTRNKDVKASFYSAMADVYIAGIPPIEQDGAKALECYEKALEVAEYDKSLIYSYMAGVYKQGIYPIPVDKEKAKELLNKR